MSLIEELVSASLVRAKTLPRREVRPPRELPSFRDALRGKASVSVIAEYKRSSPSLGAIAERNLVEQVVDYERAGAAALSVLTEPVRFRGSYQDLETAAAAVSLPVLMKDFIVHPAQVREAAHLGASAVLLIVRCLDRSELVELAALACELGLTPLIECHHACELDTALAIDDAVIGVNNRDLDTLEIDRSLAPRLLSEAPDDRVVVAESGYFTADDVEEVLGVADAALIGSALMRRDHPGVLIDAIRQRVRA
jgi:indole-3-glycerol phosphate synthase